MNKFLHFLNSPQIAPSTPDSYILILFSLLDRTILLWDIKDLTQKDRKSLRVNLNDYATYIKWSPDNKAFLVTKYSENAIEVYKIVKKTDAWLSQPSKGLTVTKTHEDSVIVGLDIAANGKFVMTCSRDNQLLIWSLNLEVVTKIDTYLMYTNRARISPCGRFIAACGFAPDVKVWEVVFNKQKELQEVPRVFELCGHTSEVYDVDFDADTSHIASVSKDGTWKVFDTKVEYKKGEDPRLKTSGKLCGRSEPSKIAFSPDSEVVVIGTASSLHFYSVRTGNLDRTIDNIFDGTPITCMKFDPMGKFLFASGNKYVRIFNNVTGLKCAIENAKRKLCENQTSATKERLRKQIEDNEREIEEIDGK